VCSVLELALASHHFPLKEIVSLSVTAKMNEVRFADITQYAPFVTTPIFAAVSPHHQL
jgi:hypothetical protein